MSLSTSRRRPVAAPLAVILSLALVGCTTADSSSAPGVSIGPGSEAPHVSPSTEPGEPGEPGDPPAHRIGVRTLNGHGEFFDRLTGETFVARGANLIRLDDYHNTFGDSSYDPADLDGQLARMAAQGYNVVRVFLDQRPGALAKTGANALSTTYLDNVADFLRRAKTHGIYVMLTQDWLPDGTRWAIADVNGIGGLNAAYLAANGVTANRRYFGDLVQGLIARGAALDAIWAYQLRNELYLDLTAEPFTLTAGEVQAANGETYDLSDGARRRALLEDGIVFWADAMRAEILRHDPTALVSIGFFVPHGPNPARQGDTRVIETRAVIERSQLDFVDLHAYPGNFSLADHMENFGLPRDGRVDPAKPIVMAEMGAFHDHYPDETDAARVLIDWQTTSCSWGLDGWLLWTWDSGGSPTGVWNGTDGDGLLAEVLSPTTRADPCAADGVDLPVDDLARGRPATVSGQIAGHPGDAAVDGSDGTLWNSGGYAPQWIQIDLGQPQTIGEVRLVVDQSPPGATEHRIYGAADPEGPLILLHAFEQDTSTGDVLAFTPPAGTPPIRILRVETVASPSWVAWRSIEGAPG